MPGYGHRHRSLTLGRMTFLALHALAYVVVNGLVIAVWFMIPGDGTAFWPRWPLVGWGALLLMHAGIVALWRRSRSSDDDQPEERQTRGGGRGGKAWIAVMFVDIADSTRLSESLGDEAWSEMISSFRTIVRETAASHGGSEVGTQGDGSLLRFPSPSDAVDCAGVLHRRLRQARDAGDLPADVRIGVHAGQVIERDEDVLGKMVNVAARVADEAEAGEVLVTEPVIDHAGREVDFDDRGLRALKGIEAPRHLLALRTPAGDG